MQAAVCHHRAELSTHALALAAALHAAYTVDTNKLGQVVRIRSSQPSRNATFDLLTRDNALQAFIRRPNGTAVAGVFTLTYDYSPTTHRIERDVQMLHSGGVDPNAKGAVTVELEREQAAARDRAQAARKLPDFNKIVGPTAKP